MARDFNGTTDRIDYVSPFDPTGKPITFAARVWFDVLSQANSQFIFNASVSGGGSGLVIFQNGAVNQGMIGFTRVASTNLLLLSNVNVVSANKWFDIVMTHDGVLTTVASCHIYINNVETTYNTTTNGAAPETSSNSGFSLGGRLSTDDRNFNGRLAEVAIWSRVLNASERARRATAPATTVPAGLQFYAPLLNDHRDVISKTGTLDGTTVLEHPPMIYPAKRRVFAAAAGSSVAAIAMARRQSIGLGVF